jgi:hypothetical protein
VYGGDADAGDHIEPLDRPSERGDQLLDLGLDRGDVGAGLVDAGEHGAQQEPVVVGEVPGERLFQQGILTRIRARASWASAMGACSPAISAVFSAVRTATRSAR